MNVSGLVQVSPYLSVLRELPRRPFTVDVRGRAATEVIGSQLMKKCQQRKVL